VLCALLSLVLTLVFWSTPALAFKGYTPGGSFGEPCSAEPCGNGQFKEPMGAAVNDSTGLDPAAGDVYVVDSGDNRVERFSSTGAYEGQFDGSGTFEVKGKVETGTAAPSGQLSVPEQIAVDNSGNPLDPSAGDVYVEDSGHKAIDKFSSTGEYISQLTETTGGSPFGELLGVAVDPSGNLWVYEASANVYEFNDTGSFVPAASFNSGRGPHPGLAVDSSENIYLIPGDEGVAKYESGKEVVEFSGNVITLAIDPSTNNLLVDKAGVIELYGPFGEPTDQPLETFATGGLAESHGIAVSATGTAYATQRTADNVEVFNYVPLPSVSTQAATEVSETAETLHGTVNPEGEAIAACRFEYGTTTSYGQSVPCEQTPETLGKGTEPVAVSAKLSGLPPSPVRHVRLAAANANGTRYGNDVTIEEPGVGAESSSHVSSTEARVDAQIDAHGEPATYHVEYGTSGAYGSSTAEVHIGAPQGAVGVSAQLSKLRPETEYHFRFVATNTNGSDRGPDATFTTPTSSGASAVTLPDGRVYELVSTSSGPGEVYAPEAPSRLEEDSTTEEKFQAATGGDAVAYAADPGVIGGNGATGLGLGNEWLATRGSVGWMTSDITPVGSKSKAEYEHFSSNLLTGFVETDQQPPLASDAPAGCQLLYSRASSSGAYATLFTTTKNPGVCGHPHFAGESADGSRVLLQSEAALTEDAQEAEQPSEQENHHSTGSGLDESCEFSCNLYIAVKGQLQLVNVLPKGEADPNATFGGPSDLHKNGPDLSNVISTDGSRVFWTDTKPGPGMNHIYVLEDGTTNVQVSGEGAAHYWTATPDGRYALYIEDEGLWRFDTKSNTREELVSEGLKGENAGVHGVIGINESGDDGAYVYLMASGVLASNENTEKETAKPRTCITFSDQNNEIYKEREEGKISFEKWLELNSEIEQEKSELKEGKIPPKAGCNLYLLHAGTPIRFIATLAPEDNELIAGNTCCGEQYGDWVANLGRRTAEVTPDGKHLVFESLRPLTGYDNVDPVSLERTNEVFVYAADTGRLACASCDPTGATPSITYGARYSLLRATESDTYMPRLISEDGDRAFFDTSQPLLPQDTNGVQDVYEWEREGTSSCPETTPARRDGGCVFLLSGGESSDYSFFVDTDTSGDNAFFTTRAQLVSQDRDEKTDLYDARVNGGFPTYPLACTGTGCQGVPSGQPIFATPSSVTFNGVGNFGSPPTAAAVKPKTKPKSCKKGFVRKHGKCVKKPKKAKKASKRSKRGSK
jgi:hypothetical protein